MELARWDRIIRLIAGEGLAHRRRKRRWKAEISRAQIRLEDSVEYAHRCLVQASASIDETKSETETGALATAVRGIYLRLGFSITYTAGVSWPDITLQETEAPENGCSVIVSPAESTSPSPSSSPSQLAVSPSNEPLHELGNLTLAPSNGFTASLPSSASAGSHTPPQVKRCARSQVVTTSVWALPAEQTLPPRYLQWFTSRPTRPAETHDYGADADFSSVRYHKAVPGWNTDSNARFVLNELRRDLKRKRLDNSKPVGCSRPPSSASFGKLASSNWHKPLASSQMVEVSSPSTRSQDLWFETRDLSKVGIGRESRLRSRVSHLALALARLATSTLPPIPEALEESEDSEGSQESDRLAPESVYFCASAVPESLMIERIESLERKGLYFLEAAVQENEVAIQLPDSGLVLAPMGKSHLPHSNRTTRPLDTDTTHAVSSEMQDRSFANHNAKLGQAVRAVKQMAATLDNNNPKGRHPLGRPIPKPNTRLPLPHVALDRRESMLESRFKSLRSKSAQMEVCRSSHRNTLRRDMSKGR